MRRSGVGRPTRHGAVTEPARELVAVDALGGEDARHGAVLGGEQAAEDVLACRSCVSPLRLASLTARSSPSLADVPQLGFVRRQLAARSTPRGIDPDGAEHALEVALTSASRSSCGSRPTSLSACAALLLPDAIAISRCSASTLLEPRPAATLVASSAAYRASRTNRPNILQPPGVFLVDRLPGDAERLGDLRPRPPVAQRALDLGVLHAVGEAAERDDGGEAVGGALGVGELGGRAAWSSNLS